MKQIIGPLLEFHCTKMKTSLSYNLTAAALNKLIHTLDGCLSAAALLTSINLIFFDAKIMQLLQ